MQMKVGDEMSFVKLGQRRSSLLIGSFHAAGNRCRIGFPKGDWAAGNSPVQNGGMSCINTHSCLHRQITFDCR